MLANHILPRFGATPLSQLSRTEIRARAVGLGRRYRPSTVASIAALLTGILAEAVREGMLASTPALRLRPVSGHRPRHHLDRERGRGHRGAPGRQRRPARAHGRLHRNAVERTGGGRALPAAPRTALRRGSSRIHPVHPDRPRHRRRPPVRRPRSTRAAQVRCGSARGTPAPISRRPAQQTPGPGTFVFTARNGGRLHASNFCSRVWKPALARLSEAGLLPRVPDLETMTFHQLRYARKTWMAEHHTPPSLQDYRMGHAPRGIQGRYEHHTPAMITELIGHLHRRPVAAETAAAPPAELPASPLRCPVVHGTRPSYTRSGHDRHGCARNRLRRLPPPTENRAHRDR